jgi:site-specific recombinase XerD
MKTGGKKTVTRYNGGRIRELDNGSVMADFVHKGRRRRACFKTLALAKTAIDAWRIEADNLGRASFDIGDRDRLELAQARKEGLTASVADVVSFWKKHHPNVARITVADLIEKFMDAPGRRGKKAVKRRVATEQGHVARFKPLREHYGDRDAQDIMRADIEALTEAHGWAGLNLRHYMASMSALWRFAIRKGFCTMNPCEEIELPEADATEPIIMTPSDVARYLQSMEACERRTVHPVSGIEYVTRCADLLPREAIAFFCGLRPEELSRLDWRNVSLANKTITVTGAVAKIQGHRRNVDMPDNLIHWLAPYAKDAGRVWPHESKTTLVRRRKMAQAAARVDVPDNAGRHCFASYHLAMHRNEHKTASLLGHADVKLLKNVYANIVASDGRPITKKNAEDFFSIMPTREAGVLRFRAAG